MKNKSEMKNYHQLRKTDKLLASYRETFGKKKNHP